MKLSISILILLSAVVYESLLDANKIGRGESINYKFSIFMRGVLFLTLSYFTCIHNQGSSIESVHRFIDFLIVESVVYWILFDFLLNKFRGLSLDYIGKTSDFDRVAIGKFKNLYEYTIYKIFTLPILLITSYFFTENLLKLVVRIWMRIA